MTMNSINNKDELDKIYKEFCSDTKRCGSVLISSSIREWSLYLLERADRLGYTRPEISSQDDITY